MRLALALVIATTFACKSPEEMIVEAATGGKVDIEKGKVTIKGEDGEVVTMNSDEEGGKVTITNEKGEKATIDGKDGTMRVVSDDGVAEFGTGKLPEDFPLELIDGAKVVTSSSSNEGDKQSFHVMAHVDKAPKEVADFYAEKLEAAGFKKVKRTEHSMGNGAMITLNGRKGKKLTAAVTAVREKEGDKTMLTVVWSAR
jgi:hypothetical protein